jgi:hypothetical protein
MISRRNAQTWRSPAVPNAIVPRPKRTLRLSIARMRAIERAGVRGAGRRQVEQDRHRGDPMVC